MAHLGLHLIQNLSLQLSTSLALEQGVNEIHDLVYSRQKDITGKALLHDIKAIFLKAGKSSLFHPKMPATDMLKSDRALLDQALSFAVYRHLGEYRDSGHPYLSHVLSTGFMLARLGFPKEVVLAGILHDALEDTSDKSKILNDLYKLNPAIAFYVYSVSGPDINDSREKDKILYSKITALAQSHNNVFPLAIKCFDSLANIYDLDGMQSKDGKSALERQRQFLDKTIKRIIPFAQAIDSENIVRIRNRKEIFSVEEYARDIIRTRKQSLC